MRRSDSNSNLYRVLFLAVLSFFSVYLNAEYSELAVFRGLNQSELNESEWVLNGRAELESEQATILDFSSAIYENLPDRSDYFIIYGDSLLWTGYSVGRNMGLLSESPVLFRKSVYNFEDDAPEYYRCHGKLDVNTRFKEGGEIEWGIVGEGTAIVSPGDTIRNVRLTRQAFRHRTIMGDTAMVDMPDVVTYRWYVPGQSAPLAIQREGKLYINEDFSDHISSDGLPENSGYDQVKNIIDSASIVYDGWNINISMPDEINITAFLMDEAGNIYGVTSGVTSDFVINVRGLLPGRYILSLVAEPEALYVRKELIML